MNLSPIGSVDETHTNEDGKLTRVECYLHRVFPSGFYEESAEEIVNGRVFKPRKDCEDYVLNIPVDWEAQDRRVDRNWRMQLQGWAAFQPIMNFFDDFSEKESIVDYFLEISGDWFSNYKDDPDDVVTTRMPKSYAWYDMSVGFRALIIAFFIERIEYFSVEIEQHENELLNALAIKHIRNLSEEKTFSLNNHGLFQIQGLMCLVQVLGVNSYSKEHAYAIKRMEELVCSQFDSDGVHLEHSPHYHFYSLDTVECILQSGFYDSSKILFDRAAASQDVLKWIVDPLKRPYCVGDSILTEQKRIVFPENQQPTPTGQNCIISDFNSSGYAVIRSDWGAKPSKASALFFMGMYQSKAHKHRDCLSFEWFDKGGRILVDSGKYGYRSDIYRNYVLSNRAHNTVEIEGFDILKMKPYGSIIKDTAYLGGELYIIEAALEYPAIKHNRVLTYKPGKWLLIQDTLNFQREREYTQWHHFDPKYHLTRQKNNSFHLDAEEGEIVLVDTLSKGVKTQYARGDENDVQGFVCTKDYQIEPGAVIGFSGSSKAATLLTLISLGHEERDEALSYIKGSLNQFKESADELKQDSQLSLPAILPNLETKIVAPDQNVTWEIGQRVRKFTQGAMSTYFHENIKDHKKLAVFLPGASTRKNGPQDFQRFGWGDELPCSVLCFTDPTLSSDNDIGLAWFQGIAGEYGVDSVAKVISAYMATGNIEEKNLFLFGSSGGGFAALKLGAVFNEAAVMAINPQLYLYNYSKPHYEHMLAVAYPGLTHEEVFKKYKSRIVVDEKSVIRTGNTVVFQNRADLKHMNKHLAPLIKKIPEKHTVTSDWPNLKTSDTTFSICYYMDESLGHSPPNKDTTLVMMKEFLTGIGY